VTAEGHPRAIFNRAIERGNLAVAEVTVREIGRISLAEALELTALVARRDPGRMAVLERVGTPAAGTDLSD
jgi:hypothetical protein